MFSKSFSDFIHCFSQLPGIGQKSSERIAFFLLKQSNSFVEKLSNSIINLKQKSHFCSICGNISDTEPCQICTDRNRDNEVICVVENPFDIYVIESTNSYNGLYHSIGGVISPLNGITPENLNIDSLIKRINNNKIKEIIFALSSTTEGDATALYIKDLLKNKNITFSHLARGIPIGTSIMYAGVKSISEAIKGREKIID